MRVLFLALLLLQPLSGEVSLLPGEVTPRVICQAKPNFTYALYLPKAYREDRAWPVLFGFSPGGGGEEPVRLFQKAAERFGWIVVGSNDSRNGPLRPALEASDAMWKDVHKRFRVDPQRSYAVGFSGGARMALRLALKHPKDFAGLISIGAFGTGEGLLTGLGHLRFYLGCGLEDFNHWELLEGRRELRSRGWKVLADRFEGGHLWIPEKRAAAILGWLEWGAHPDDAALESEIRDDLTSEAVQAGTSLLALRRWREIVDQFPDSPAGSQSLERIRSLESHSAVIEELRLEASYAAASRTLSALKGDAAYSAELATHIDRLTSAPPLEQMMLRRLLGGPIIAYRMALGEALERKQWEQVLSLASSLAALDDREGWPCIYVAVALVQLGRPQEALPHLRTAQARGYRKPERIRALETLKPLRGDPGFEAILKAMEPEP